MFQNLTNEGLEDSQDRLGGFQALESDIYTGTVKMAYTGESSGGAIFVHVVFDFKGTEFRTIQYVTNKKKENFFVNQSQKKIPLPGFNIIDDLCLATIEKPLSQVVPEEKSVMVYDRDAQKELPKAMPVLVDLIGKEVSVGVIKQIVNRNVKNQSTGKYEPTAETREENEVDKVFHTASKRTIAEARNGEDAIFWDKWLDRNKGETRDRTVKVNGGQGGNDGAPKAAQQNAPSGGSLFS